jgi:alpha-tubulin suppressor-like RCC1 family protein
LPRQLGRDASPVSGAAISKTFTLAAGASTAALSLGALPPGQYDFAGKAFDVACTSISTAQPSWVADPATASLQPGIASTVNLTFRKNNPVTAVANFVHNITSISAGYTATYVTTEAAPLQWGNSWSNGGGGPTIPRATAVAGLADAVSIAGGADFACALRADGSVWCWGYNDLGVLGPTVANNTASATPLKIPLPSPVTLLAAGQTHACAGGAGGLWCWGNNLQGQLGDGTTVSKSTPVQVLTRPVMAIAAGDEATAALSSTGSFFAWGANQAGEQGNGTTTATKAPPATGSTTIYTSLAMAGKTVCATRLDGSLQCWGNNAQGQVGDGTTVNRSTPTNVALPSGARQVGVSTGHTCALSGNDVMCWGDGTTGALGNSTAVIQLTPTRAGLPNGAAVSGIAVGQGHTCALMGSQKIFCWGSNNASQLGDGTVNYAYAPELVPIQ